MMENILEFVKPELLVLVPVLYFIGAGLKKWQAFSNRFIPIVLGASGIALAALWTLASSELSGYRDVLLAGFSSVVQGILCAGCSVYANQLLKQIQK